MVRPAPDGHEVLMVERPARGFFGGLWVFPGGAVEPADRSELAQRVVLTPEGCDDTEWRAAALRETAEEVGLIVAGAGVIGPLTGTGRGLFEQVDSLGEKLDARRLRLVSNWVTPEGAPVRFDTRFYLTVIEGDPDLVAQPGEVIDVRWTKPVDALARFDDGEWSLVTPTIHHLKWLAAFDDVTSIWEAADAAIVSPVTPVVERDGSVVRLHLPAAADLP